MIIYEDIYIVYSEVDIMKSISPAQQFISIYAHI